MTTSHSKSPNASHPEPVEGPTGPNSSQAAMSDPWRERQSKPQAKPSAPSEGQPYGRGWADVLCSDKKDTPLQISRFLDLVRCESLRDFLDPEKMTRIKNMPFWILADEKEQTMWFDHVTPNLSKDELLRYIRAGLVYIRRSDAKDNQTISNH